MTFDNIKKKISSKTFENWLFYDCCHDDQLSVIKTKGHMYLYNDRNSQMFHFRTKPKVELGVGEIPPEEEKN